METPRYNFFEEVANLVTHAVGLALSVAGLTLLVTFAGLTGDPWRIVSFSIYGAALVILYASSTLYHGVPSASLKRVFRRFDHAAIYLLIAGTYTPFVLVLLRGGLGWTMFGIVWALAAFGVAVKVAFTGRFEILTVVLYLGMGWMGIAAIKPVIAAMPAGGLALLLAGGAAYTVGVIFYAGRCIPFNHAIWHVFVITGSVCHFLTVILFLL